MVCKDTPSIWTQEDRYGITDLIRVELAQNGTVFHDNASVWVLMDWYRDFIDGLILCGSDLSSINAATSLCGPMNAIAVNESLMAQVQNQTGLPVLADVRGYSASDTYNNYQNIFGHEFVVHQHPLDWLRDFAVKYNTFTFYDIGSFLFRQYLGGLTSQGTAMGWGDEYYFIRDSSMVNGSGIAADYNRNLSALSKLQIDIPSPPMKYPAPAQEGQRIVAIVMSDGDNLGAMAGALITDGKYFSNPHFGTFSMSWEFPPRMADFIPMGVKQFYELPYTGDNVNCFIAGPSGAGYAYHYFMPDRQPFAQSTGRLMKKCGLKVTTMLNPYDGSMSDSDELLDRPEIMGVVYKDYPAYNYSNGAMYWHNGKPCVAYKYNLGEVGEWDTISAAIASLPSSPTTNPGSYALVNVYAWGFRDIGGPMEAIKRLVDILPANTRAVTVDEFIILLRNNFGDPVTEQEYYGM